MLNFSFKPCVCDIRCDNIVVVKTLNGLNEKSRKNGSAWNVLINRQYLHFCIGSADSALYVFAFSPEREYLFSGVLDAL